MTKNPFLACGDPLINDLVSHYARGNCAARIYADISDAQGWSFVIDHVAVRCLQVETRAQVFLDAGYAFQNESVEYPDQGWWAKVYRKSGQPVVFVDQAYEDARGEKSIIPAWVKRFGDKYLHHIAVLVDDIDQAVAVLKTHGVQFAGEVVGSPGSRLRQVFTASEVREGAAYTVLELTERNGYTGFYPDQANALMQSSTQKISE